MIDSHCHLDHEPLLSDLPNVLIRSKKIGLEKLLTISTSFESFSRVKELVKKDEMIFGTIGIHPHETSTNIITSKQIIENLSENSKIIGIGETGLDFYYNNSEKKRQVTSFKEHIEASIETNTPLIVHSRAAEKETFDILNEYKNEKLKILMHCFTGSKEFSKKLMTLNSFFSAEKKEFKVISFFENSFDPVKQCIKILSFSFLYSFKISKVSFSAALECTINGVLVSIDASMCSLKLVTCLFFSLLL